VQQVAVGGTGGGGGGHSIPTGRWRDELCDCCNLGCCHAVFCLGFWCRLCLLGQVLTRNKLTWIGSYNRTGKINPCSFRFWFAMMVVSVVIGFAGYSIRVVATWSWFFSSGATENNFPAWTTTLTRITSITVTVIGILGCIATCRARGKLRHQYNIEPDTCGVCEDCCCATWCGACTMCQMARHTADYHVHKAECCSATGLHANAPEVV
jgi:Cys-rich protein (TIGR01571 family)